MIEMQINTFELESYPKPGKNARMCGVPLPHNDHLYSVSIRAGITDGQVEQI